MGHSWGISSEFGSRPVHKARVAVDWEGGTGRPEVMSENVGLSVLTFWRKCPASVPQPKICSAILDPG